MCKLSWPLFIYLFIYLVAFDCLDFLPASACLVVPSLPYNQKSLRVLKSLFVGFTTFAWSSFPHSDPSLITDAVPFFFFHLFLFFPAKVKIDKHFWVLISGTLEITLQCFLLMSNANVLSTAMLTLCLLFIPTRGVVLFPETLGCADRDSRGGKQREDQVPRVVSCV